MKDPVRYIMPIREDVNGKELEDIGYVIYANPDGIMRYAIKNGAPEEAFEIASCAAQGNPYCLEKLEESE